MNDLSVLEDLTEQSTQLKVVVGITFLLYFKAEGGITVEFFLLKGIDREPDSQVSCFKREIWLDYSYQTFSYCIGFYAFLKSDDSSTTFY